MEKSVVISFEGKTLPTSFYSFPNLFLCYLSAARRGEVEEESQDNFVQGFGRFHGKTEAETEASSAVAQLEPGLVFGEYRAEEIEFWAEMLKLVS